MKSPRLTLPPKIKFTRSSPEDAGLINVTCTQITPGTKHSTAKFSPRLETEETTLALSVDLDCALDGFELAEVVTDCLELSRECIH